MHAQGGSHGSVEMGRPAEHAYASTLGHGPSPPLSGASSPSPLLIPAANAKRSTAGRRRHAIVRLICSPFAAVFTTACTRASATPNDNQATKRPSLEDLLRMEAPSNLDLKHPDEPDMADPFDDSSWKESAIVVFDFGEGDDTSGAEDEAPPLAISRDQHATVPRNEQQTVIVRADEFDPVGGPVAGPGTGAAVLMNVERRVLVLAALRARSRALKGSYGRLAGRHAGGVADKAELFYDRPIPLGRRCRVQHLEETPYF
uniref:Uncharacterized protein n=1 Tax=Avena sativa TaxID=4498 RepID=A0ACD5ZYS3_AVESA